MPFNYDHKLIGNAKNLRKDMTPWERKLWYMFLCRYPIPFQRQKAIGSYIADFYCFRAGLIIELDGSQHYDPEIAKYDNLRTEMLERYGVRVIRIPNNEIDHNFAGVCEYIDAEVKKSLHT